MARTVRTVTLEIGLTQQAKPITYQANIVNIYPTEEAKLPERVKLHSNKCRGEVISKAVHSECQTPVVIKTRGKITNVLRCPKCKVPVREEEVETQFFCNACQSRVDQKKKLVIGYKIDSKCVATTPKKSKEIESFLPDLEKLMIYDYVWPETIDPKYCSKEKLYGLEPRKGGEYWHTWLRCGLQESGAVACAEGGIRQPRQIILIPYNEEMFMRFLVDYDRVSSSAIHKAKVQPEAIATLKEYILKKARNFDPQIHCRNAYRETVENLLAEQEQKEVKLISLPPRPTLLPTPLPEEIESLRVNLEKEAKKSPRVAKAKRKKT